VNRLKMLVFVKFYRNRKLRIKFYIPHNKTIVPTNTQSFTEIRRFLATVLFTDIGETDRQTDRQTIRSTCSSRNIYFCHTLPHRRRLKVGEKLS